MKPHTVKGVIILLLLALCIGAGVLVGRGQDQRLLFFPIAGAEKSKGMVASYWPTACDDLLDLDADMLIGGHPHAPACLQDHPEIEYVPHIDFRDLDHEPVPARYALTLNEPEGCGPQAFFSCKTPQEAVPILEEVVARYGADYILTYPGLAAPPQDLSWLPDFRAEWVGQHGSPPPLSVIVVHCYNTAEVCIQVVSYFVGLCEAWEECQEVWVTEFGLRIGENFPECLLFWDDWRQELVDQVNYYQAEPLITRYFFLTNRMAPDWYADFSCAPVSHAWETGHLLEQGALYRDLPGPYP